MHESVMNEMCIPLSILCCTRLGEPQKYATKRGLESPAPPLHIEPKFWETIKTSPLHSFFIIKGDQKNWRGRAVALPATTSIFDIGKRV